MLKRVLTAVVLLACLSACNRDPNVAKRKYVENGNKYFEKGRYKEAVIMYKNALRRDAKFGEAYYRLALTEIKLQRWGDAARNLVRAVELQPENLDAHQRLANLLLNAYLADPRRGKALMPELTSISEKFSQRFPHTYEDARLKGFIGLFNKDSKTALEQFELANKLKPHQPDLVLVYMQTLAGVGRPAEAEALAKDLLQNQPSAMTIYDALYLFYMRTNRVADAEQVMKTKLEKNPKVADVYLQLSAHYYATKQRDNMMATLTRLSSNRETFPNAQLMVGDFFLRTRELDLALQQYDIGVKTDASRKADYQKRIVEVKVKQGKRDEANQLIREVLQNNPKDPEAIAIRASLSLLTGTKEELQSAINDLQTVVSQLPTNPVLRYNLGRAHLARNNIQGARVEFEEAIKLRPDYLLPRIALADLMLRHNEFGKAIAMAQEILAYDQMSVAGRLIRTRALIGLGDVKQARAELTETAAKFPNLTEPRLQLATLDLRSSNPKEAENNFRKLYSQSQDGRAFMGIVESLVAQKQNAEALKLLREELSKKPDRLDFRVAAGNIAVQDGDHGTAIAEFKKVLEKAPRAADVWLRLGEAYRRAGDAGSAVSSFRKAQELAPNTVLPYMQLAMLYDTQGQRAEAKPLYEQILRIEPDNPIALNNLAFMLAESGADLDQALTMAQKAKQRMPQDANVADTLGWIYIKKNLPDSAIQLFSDLVKKQPERAMYRYHFAMALYQKGDKAQAKREAEMALKSRPSKDEESRIRELMAKL